METGEVKNKSSEPSKKEKRRGNGFEDWGGYMAAKKAKLVSQFEHQKSSTASGEEEKTSKLFSGISIYVNGYTKPSSDELKRLMMLHGGTFHYYYTSNTTFMVASNLPDSKIKSLKTEKVITPSWIVDCIKAKRILPYQSYLLYSPETKDRQKRLDKRTLPTSVVRELRKIPPAPISSIKQEPAERIKSNGNTPHAEKADPSKFREELPSASHVSTKSPNKNEASPSSSKSPKPKDDKYGTSMRAGHPDFISEFYSRSRLHHISTAGQELKQYVQQLASERKGKPFTGRDRIRVFKRDGLLNESYSFGTKSIMHIDMDCFFVSVGLKKFPELRGHPVAVAHSRGVGVRRNDDDDKDAELAGESSSIVKSSSDFESRSEIACCSYEARRAGVHNGMYLGQALKRCPQLKTIPYDFEEYSKVSKQLYDIVTSYTFDVEAVSCDELYIDCTELLKEVKISPSDFASLLREEIHDVTGCTASAGVGKNMLLARLATRVAKPNGQYVLMENEEIEFMKKQKVEDLPGVGHSTSRRLNELGIYTCGDLQRMSLGKLQQEFGNRSGLALFDHCRGKDDKTVSLEKDRKSVSAEINYGIRFEQEQDIYDFLNEIAVEVHQRLKSIEKKGRSITLKLKIRRQDAPKQTAKFMGHGICDNVSKSTALKSATDDPKIIANECCSLARSLKIVPEDYRGVGIQVGKLESSGSDPKSNKTMEAFLARDCGPRNFDISRDSDRQNSSETSNQNIRMTCEDDQNDSQDGPPDIGPPMLNYHTNFLPEELDQSVLNALPEEIRMEVLSAYAGQQQQLQNLNSIACASNSVPNSISGKSETVSSRSRKNKISKPPPPHNTLEWYLKSKPIDNMIPSDCCCSESEPDQVTRTGKAHLGGAVDIDEVRDIVKEWVTSAEGPGEDDVEQFKDYLLQLIEEDLEKMNFVLKYFYRIVNAASIIWKETYLLILSYVQQKMLQDYGHMLKAESKFEEM